MSMLTAIYAYGPSISFNNWVIVSKNASYATTSTLQYRETCKLRTPLGQGHVKCVPISELASFHNVNSYVQKKQFGASWSSLISQDGMSLLYIIQWNLWIATLRNEDILWNKDTSSGPKLMFSMRIALWYEDTSGLGTLLARTKGVLISQVSLYTVAIDRFYWRSSEVGCAVNQ
jgi:hypothetical protein